LLERSCGSIVLGCLFPPRCPVCGGLRIPWESLTCTECAGKLRKLREPLCMRCGCEVSDERTEYCADCKDRRSFFVRNYAVWQYDKQMKRSVADFKYNGRTEYTDFYVYHMANSFGKQLLRHGVTALVPVPVAGKRKRFRGFNQAELLAEGLAKVLGLQVVHLLKRVQNTVPQSKLSRKERKENLLQSMEWDEKEESSLPVLPKCVAIVDDIYTTGATMEACAQVLAEHGISGIYGVCICLGSASE